MSQTVQAGRTSPMSPTYPDDDHYRGQKDEVERLRLRAIYLLEKVSPRPKKVRKPQRRSWLARKLWGVG